MEYRKMFDGIFSRCKRYKYCHSNVCFYISTLPKNIQKNKSYTLILLVMNLGIFYDTNTSLLIIFLKIRYSYFHKLNLFHHLINWGHKAFNYELTFHNRQYGAFSKLFQHIKWLPSGKLLVCIQCINITFCKARICHKNTAVVFDGPQKLTFFVPFMIGQSIWHCIIFISFSFIPNSYKNCIFIYML